MSVAASKVKSLCTDAEVALVRASRSPELEKHSAAEIKPLATRARKLFDKWQGLSRKQSRSRNRQVGSAEEDSNTRLKAQIFREALDAFEGRQAKLSETGKTGTKGSRAAAKTKKSRAAEHRQARAAVRAGMTAALDLTNAKPVAKKKPKKAAVAKPAKVVKPAAKPAKKAATKSSVKKGAKKLRSSDSPLVAGKNSPAQPLPLNPGKQLRASTVAKQARVARSGQATRVHGHVSARGKRSQARRDSKR